ncbi:MAG: energy-coupling factor ABC transporter permease [Erysipelotrichaceae bacterium]|nr:energy-coupling factor ABC transporter permease [Erysipelotrichaceae bacterium]
MNVLMHMADGLISVPIGFIFIAVAVIAMGYSLKKINESHDEKKIPMMAVMGAFVFVAQMINFTIPATGSSGHIGGGILLCLILGQYPAFLAMCSVLIIQCLFFGDGGMLALGCNMFNMGLIPCFIVYPLIVKPLLKNHLSSSRIVLSSMIGAVVGLELGAFCVVLETLASQITELPFTLFVSLMLPIHLAIGIVEGIITSAVVCYVYKESPHMIDYALVDKNFNMNYKKLIGVFLVLVVLIGGGLSLYASSYPDGLEWSIGGITGDSELEASGEVKEALASVQETTSFLPDYSFSNSDSILGTSTSGIVGGAMTIFVLGAVGYIFTRKKSHV